MTFFHQQTGELRTWARRALWFIFVTGALCSIVLPIFMIYRREGDNARSVVEVEPQGVSHTGDFIHVLGSVASVDFENKNFRVHFEFTAHGTLAGDDGVLAAAVSISMFYTTLAFPAGQIMRSVDVTMPYMQGATIDYPFDAYKSYFEILANKDHEQLHKIPVSLTFLGKLQSVEFIPTVQLNHDDLYKISIVIFTRRSPTTIGFSLFIVLIMWMLSIAIGIIAIQVIKKYRVSDEHVLTLGITTLFALPALRETQPGIPAIGCAADVLGFYWNMAIIAISSIMILMASALRWKQPSIKRELELVQKQHEYQSKLIQEMAIPMPLPLTGGPLFDYQVKKKRVPFGVSRFRSHPPTTPSFSVAAGVAAAAGATMPGVNNSDSGDIYDYNHVRPASSASQRDRLSFEEAQRYYRNPFESPHHHHRQQQQPQYPSHTSPTNPPAVVVATGSDSSRRSSTISTATKPTNTTRRHHLEDYYYFTDEGRIHFEDEYDGDDDPYPSPQSQLQHTHPHPSTASLSTPLQHQQYQQQYQQQQQQQVRSSSMYRQHDLEQGSISGSSLFGLERL
ncbi:hypothetical protein BG015_004610 [Linnemannia schmuckeri]|uniref:Uncharacterized protein n=1 Tax=Linnemannia schmuckeri TaxID=64567 RepID=A0A9P5S475_9FUNG|nr:hypothetical protein BG015_004610 [Linnemannia schmuckeri]